MNGAACSQFLAMPYTAGNRWVESPEHYVALRANRLTFDQEGLCVQLTIAHRQA